MRRISYGNSYDIHKDPVKISEDKIQKYAGLLFSAVI